MRPRQRGQVPRTSIVCKTVARRAALQDAPDRRIVDFGHGLASAADQQLGGMLAASQRTAHEGIEGVDAVDQAGAGEEIQRPVDRRRSGLAA